MSKKKQQDPLFKTGDRVAEKPKPRLHTVVRASVRDRIKPFTTQRYGTVVETVYQKTTTGRRVPYVKIIWDHAASPSVHSQNRICFEKDLNYHINDFFNAHE
jgi:hypothetical protein